MKVVIQCGGLGTRLRPYTMVLPKPLMPVGSKPVLELLLKWLRRNGAQDVFITTGYLGGLIQAVCRDGAQWDMRITYSDEREPLGTIGPLSLIRDRLDSTFVVVNGDVLTDLNFSAFIATHNSNKSMLTIATATRNVKIDFGVIEDCAGLVTQFREKPTITQAVSMGIYCMEPEILEYVPCGVPFGFDDLLLTLMRRGVPVRTFKHDGAWLDVGRVQDFQDAQDQKWDNQPPAFSVVAAA
jgi:NDP-sugar pyrophosphorylase family protein